MELKIWLFKNGHTLRDFAKSIDFQETYLSKIINGRRKPGRKLIKKILEATNNQVNLQETL